MTTLPPITDHDDGDAPVVRTDFGDDDARETVKALLNAKWGSGSLSVEWLRRVKSSVPCDACRDGHEAGVR
ncbi:hypothetical protein GCM10018793_35340 [Streptomyces sulfonofaciens]|uniref:Uncharacterized protein n=1 Tax=Streptomyces sulfonofaciens TaxID=68272 RepID=A0A919GAH8_9ACTN|nr:hypothetical protein GCM10018793_35340 [Streptomyces sulfonofaciens]